MDTNERQFQDALHQLTTAFFHFLDVVNPNGLNQADEIRYISQMLQNLSSHFGGMPTREPIPSQISVEGNDEKVEEAVVTPSPEVSPQPPLQVTPTLCPESSRSFPTNPNMFKSSPVISNAMGRFVFRKLEVNDGVEKCFEFYISGDQGLFAMKPVSRENWAIIYENKERLLPNTVVTVEGDILPNASLECIEPGLVRQDTSTKVWLIEKPCRVRISPA